jgi:hypothetical protein
MKALESLEKSIDTHLAWIPISTSLFSLSNSR